MFQMEIQPGVVPSMASSCIILSQSDLSGSDSSMNSIVFGCLHIFYERRGTGNGEDNKTTAKQLRYPIYSKKKLTSYLVPP